MSCALVALSPHTNGTGSWEELPYIHAHHRLWQVSALWRRFPKTVFTDFNNLGLRQNPAAFGILSTILARDRDGEEQGNLAYFLL